jgi:hypothetical protein
LEVLTQIMPGHCQQYGVKIDAAPEIRLGPFAPVGADLVRLIHVPPLTSAITLPGFTITSADEANKANQMSMNLAKGFRRYQSMRSL